MTKSSAENLSLREAILDEIYKANLSISFIAQKTELPVGTISKLLNGKRFGNIETWSIILHKLGFTVTINGS